MPFSIITSGFQPTTLSGSGGTVPQVQGLLLDLQAQAASNTTPSPPAPPLPNQQAIRWNSMAADFYRVYRGANGGVIASYDTSPVNSYTDLNATLCVNGAPGTGPDFYPANKYLYQVAAVVGGVEGPRSATQSCIYYANGVQEHTGGDFNNGATTDYVNAGGAPQGGHTLCALVTTTTAFGEWIPWAGNLAARWNLGLSPFNFFRIDVKANQVSSLQFVPIRVGDVAIQAQAGGQLLLPSTNYAVLVPGAWVTLVIPLADLMTDWTSGSGVQQHAWYKLGIQSTSGSTGQSFFFDNLMFTP